MNVNNEFTDTAVIISANSEDESEKNLRVKLIKLHPFCKIAKAPSI